jgi:FkbM family methyltransferase
VSPHDFIGQSTQEQGKVVNLMIPRRIFTRLQAFGSKSRLEVSNQITADLYRLSFLELEILENEIAQELGKGWGSSTVTLEVEALKNLAEQFEIQIRGAIDVGANVGDWSIAFINSFPGIQIYSYEPQVTAFEKLRETFEKLNLENIHAVRAALVPNSTGEVTLFKDIDGSGLASMYPRRLEHFDIEFSLVEIVPTQSFSDVAKSVDNQKVNVLKLDIEGGELYLLEAIFDESDFEFDLIQFEFGGCNIDSRTFFQDFWYLFHKRGYEIYRITPSGLYRLDRYLESYETFKTTNFIAVKVSSRAI